MSWLKRLTERFRAKPKQEKLDEPVVSSLLPVTEEFKLVEKKSVLTDSWEDVQPVSEVSPAEGNRKKRLPNLSEQEIDFILQQFGMMRSNREVHQTAEKELDRQINPVSIQNLRKNPKYLARQARYRAEYTQTLNEIPLSSKVRRLEELNEMYDEIKALKQENLKLRDLASLRNERREILSQAQDEVEGKGSKHFSQSVTFNQFTNMTPEERIKYKRDLLEELAVLKTKEEPDVIHIGEATPVHENGVRS